MNSKIQIHEQFISSFHREGSSSSSSWYSTSNQRDNDLTGAKSTCIGNRFLKNKARFESFRRYSSSLNGVEGGTSFQPTIPIARNEDDDEIQESDIVICGGGPAGLLAAIMLSQKLKKRNVKPTKKMITVIDRLPEPAKSDDDSIWNDIAKFYLIGLGGRGQLALNEFGVWEDVKRRCVPVLGRKDWSPGDPNPVERIFGSSKRITTQVLPRDKLVSVLYEHIQERYSDYVTFYYGYEVQPNIDFYYKNSNSVLLQVAKCTNPTTEAEYKSLLLLDPSATQDDKRQECDIDSAMLMSTKLLIGTDGTVRSIANAMEEEDKKKYSTMNVLQKLRAGRPFRVTRYIDNNKRIYKSIPFKVPKDWRGDLNYSARTKSGINFDALPANVNGDYCGILLIKDGAEDEMTSRNSSPTNFRERLEEALPQFSQLIDDDTIRTVATKPSSQLPSFRYVSPRLHQGNNCVILGKGAPA